MKIDPVCKKEVDMHGVRYRSAYKGREYWFDSVDCKERFDSDPEAHLGARRAQPLAEPGGKVRELGGKAAERSRGVAEGVIDRRKGAATEIADGISKALRDASGRMKESDHSGAADFMDMAARETERLSAYFRDNGPDRIIREAEDYVRGNPALSIGGAAAAGFLLARILKSGSGYEEAA